MATFFFIYTNCDKRAFAAHNYTAVNSDEKYYNDVKYAPLSSYGKGWTQNPNGELITVQLVWRHGIRTPLLTFSTDRYSPLIYNGYGVKGFGQLTEPGIVEAYKLGKYIRKRYKGFIGNKYSPGEIYIVSSDIDRTIMSGIAVCQALYPKLLEAEDFSNDIYGWGQQSPEAVWIPVPIRRIPVNEDNLIAQSASCANYQILYSQYVNSFAINTPSAIELYKYLTDHSRVNTSSYVNVFALYDTIFTIQSETFGLPVPFWAYRVKYEMQLLALIKYYGFVDSFEMIRFIVGPMLYQLEQNFECAMGIGPSNCNLEKLYAFSAHDTTVSPLLILFRKYNKFSPPPTTALLIFELRKKGNEYYLLIYYRPNKSSNYDDIQELLLDVCGRQRCTYNQFKNAYANYTVSNDQWNILCNQTA